MKKTPLDHFGETKPLKRLQSILACVTIFGWLSIAKNLVFDQCTGFLSADPSKLASPIKSSYRLYNIAAR
jgi:hypothetical protein